MKTFVIVEFVKEGTLTAVPSSWLDEKKEFCFFPKRNSSKSGSKRSNPNSVPGLDWEKHEVNVRYSCGKIIYAHHTFYA